MSPLQAQPVEITPVERELIEEFQRREKVREVADRCRLSLYEFVKEAWHVIEPSTPMIDNWHVKAICDAVQLVLEGWRLAKVNTQLWHVTWIPVTAELARRLPKLAKHVGKDVNIERIQNLVINVPPGTAKSRIVCVMAPCWMWLDSPGWKALFFSGNPRNVTRDSIYRRDLIESTWYQRTFRPTWTLKEDQNAKLQFNNTEGGFHSALTAGSKITGDRGDAEFLDDPNDAVDVLSEDIRTQLNELWWDQGAYNRVNEASIGTRIGIMQRLHEDDWSGHVLKPNADGTPNTEWYHLLLPQEFDPTEKCTCSREHCALPGLGVLDPRTEPGELLFVARFPESVLVKERRRLQEAGYAGQHQQRPYPKGGGLIKRQWFRYYDEDPAKMKFDEQFQSWDMTFKKTKRSDFVVGQVWGIKGPRRYLLWQFRARADLPETIKAVLLLSKLWPLAVAKYIEDKANGSGVISSLQQRLQGIIAVNPAGGKEARASAVSPLIEAGNVFLPDPRKNPWVEALLLECDAFPHGAHDDQVDAMTQALVKTINRHYEEAIDTRTEAEKLWDEVQESDKEAASAGVFDDPLKAWDEPDTLAGDFLLPPE